MAPASWLDSQNIKQLRDYMDALVVIDMQEGSFYKLDKHDVLGTVNRINLLADHVRGNGGVVIFIQHDGNDEEDLVPNTPGWEILSTLQIARGDKVVRKTTNDSYFETELNQILNHISPRKVIFSGWATDFCVDTTVRSAANHKFPVVVASDAHTVSDRPHLSAKRIIEHHNWIWDNMDSPVNPPEVLRVKEICAKY